MKRFLKIAAGLVALLVLAVVALTFLIDANTFRPQLETRLSAALGRKVTLGDLQLALWQGGVTAHDITIADDPKYSAEAFLKAASLDFGVDLWGLAFSKQLNVKSLTLNQPQITLMQGTDGNWNFSSIGQTATGQPGTTANSPLQQPMPDGAIPQGSAPLQLSMDRIRIAGGHVILTNAEPSAKPRELTDISLEIRNFTPTSAFPLTLKANITGGGDFALDGTTGPMATVASETPFDAEIQLKSLNLVGSGFVQPDADIAGLISFDGKTKSDGTRIAIEGLLRGEQLKLAKKGTPAKPVVEADLNFTHDTSTRRGIVQPTAIRVGAAKASISGTYDLAPERPVVALTFAGNKMPLQELAAFLPALDIVLPTGATLQGGELTAQMTANGPVNRLSSAGSVTISNATLANYDLGSKLRFVQQLAGFKQESATKFDAVGARYEVTPQGTTVKDLRVAAPSIGELTGSGNISPDHVLNFTMSAKLLTGGLLAAAIGQRGETTTIPFFIRGTSANPSFQANIKSVANEKLQQAIKNPEGAVKTVKGILEMFRKTKPADPPSPAK